jgi:hypothetical protein
MLEDIVSYTFSIAPTPRRREIGFAEVVESVQVSMESEQTFVKDVLPQFFVVQAVSLNVCAVKAFLFFSKPVNIVLRT